MTLTESEIDLSRLSRSVREVALDGKDVVLKLLGIPALLETTIKGKKDNWFLHIGRNCLYSQFRLKILTYCDMKSVSFMEMEIRTPWRGNPARISLNLSSVLPAEDESFFSIIESIVSDVSRGQLQKRNHFHLTPSDNKLTHEAIVKERENLRKSGLTPFELVPDKIKLMPSIDNALEMIRKGNYPQPIGEFLVLA